MKVTAADASDQAICHAGIEAWLQEERSGASERHRVTKQGGDTSDLERSNSVEPEWQAWRAALHALAAIPEAKACLFQ